MQKPIVERLRDFGNNNYQEEWMLWHDLCKSIGIDCVGYQDFALKLADEIERYYIPRPRFEDGEPVQWLDVLENGEPLCVIAYDHGGVVSINSETVNPEIELFITEPLKRSQPKVLDADGVEIKVGDMVWHIRGDGTWPYRVVDIKEGTVACITPKCPGMTAWQDPKDLTHNEPDSLEKLRDDVNELLRDGLDCENDLADSIEQRFSALIERSA